MIIWKIEFNHKIAIGGVFLHHSRRKINDDSATSHNARTTQLILRHALLFIRFWISTSILMHPRDFNGSCAGSLLSLSKSSIFPSIPFETDQRADLRAAFGDELADTLGTRTKLTCNSPSNERWCVVNRWKTDSERCGIDESAFFF